MKIVCIFAEQLYAFHYDNEDENELYRLLSLWNDVSYLYQFIKDNQVDIPRFLTTEELLNQIIQNAHDIDNALYDIATNDYRELEEFFKPLDNQEYYVVELSKQKGRKNYLRLYAIRIDKNCFVITGGAIKFHHLNKDRVHTQVEMKKIDKCRNFLKDSGVFDADSFYEFLID